MNQLEVRIMDQGYLLGCPEGGESRLREAVQKVDQAMCAIRDAGRVKARERIAVLAALNLAFELLEQPATGNADTSPVATDAPESAARLRQLLAQLDQALGDDGQLL